MLLQSRARCQWLSVILVDRRTNMTRRTKILLKIVNVTFCLYIGAYFASVRTEYRLAKTGLQPEPVYRPSDAGMVRAVFLPAHLVDAAYCRPAHWEMQALPPRESK